MRCANTARQLPPETNDRSGGEKIVCGQLNLGKHTMPSTGKQCAAITKAGHQCSNAPVAGSEYCFIHAPETARQRSEARKKGGMARHGRAVGSVTSALAVAKAAGVSVPKISLKTVDDVQRLLETCANNLLTLEKSIARERALASVAATALEVIKVGNLEDRLRALEERLTNA